MITIREIANLAKVSASTVSRVLNNDYTLSVTQETRERIFKIAQEYNYTPIKDRKSTVNTAKETTLKISVLTWCSYETELQDPYFFSIRQGIENELLKRGITVNSIIRYSRDEPILPEKCDGLIVIGKVSPEPLSVVEKVVVVNHTVDELKYDSVVIDYERATYEALSHLSNLRHHEIGFIGGREYLEDSKEEINEPRLQAFRKYMTEGNDSYNFEKHIFIGEFSISDGYELMKKAIESGELPTAFFIASDSMAIGALKALHEYHYNVPNDVSLVSFNDIEVSKYITPALTTIKVFTEKMGETAVKLLIDQLEGRDLPLKVVVPTKLIIRESCANPQVKEKK
jgi:LacI family transcriptional regulator